LKSAAIADALQSLGAYSRLPSRIETMHPELAAAAKYDKFGAAERLNAIRTVLDKRELGKMIDIGGNAGYFSISLVDCGLSSGSTVYDKNVDALAAGRLMAEALNLGDRIQFVERGVDLEFVRNLPLTDTVICLNVLHHAGAHFDVESVRAGGWESYAREWLSELAKKTGTLILGLGFKNAKPRHWNIPASNRAGRFYDLAQEAGWTVIYDANVHDLEQNDVWGAKGLRTCATSQSSSPPDDQSEPSLKSKYHLYILQK
jgi:hypothetical protein